VRQGGGPFQAKAVLAHGQELAPAARAQIEAAFGCPVFSLYRTGEFADIACEGDAHDGLLVAAEGFIVELLVNGRPARLGEQGELFVTDLSNRCMPFLRYATGDRAVAMGPDSSFPNARGLPRIGMVSGRVGGTVSGKDGARVPLGYFSALFAQYGYAVRRFRVVPRSSDALDLYIQKAARYSESTLDEVRAKIRERLGAVEIDVHFEEVETAPAKALTPALTAVASRDN
jgi:phenylacetate-CoA ligase